MVVKHIDHWTKLFVNSNKRGFLRYAHRTIGSSKIPIAETKRKVVLIPKEGQRIFLHEAVVAKVKPALVLDLFSPVLI